MLVELDAELQLLEQREDDHPKAACALKASLRYGRYLDTDGRGRPKLERKRSAPRRNSTASFVVITNDDTLSAEDAALGYKGAWIIVMALQMQRAAEIRCGLPWTRIAHVLSALKAVRYRSESRTIVQRTRIGSELAELLKKLGISRHKQILILAPAAETPAAA